jgi:hypothetical protein
MKTGPKLQFIALVAIYSFAFAACNNNGAPPAKFTVGGSVVNLAGTAGGLVLQDNLQNNLPVNANGSFSFPMAVPSGAPYSITIAAQPSNPPQTCGVTNGSGTAIGNITNIQINCGHNEWAWMNGPDTVSGTAVYGTIGVPSANNNPGPRQTPATWTDVSGNFWLFGGGGNGYPSVGLSGWLNDLWKYSNGQWTWISGSFQGDQPGIYGERPRPPILPALARMPWRGPIHQAISGSSAATAWIPLCGQVYWVTRGGTATENGRGFPEAWSSTKVRRTARKACSPPATFQAVAAS